MSDTAVVDAPTTPVDMNALVSRYIELRDLKAQMKAKHDEELAPVQTAMDRLESALLAHMQTNSSTAIKTKAGTAYITEATTASVADWDAFFTFVRQNESWQLLAHSVSKKAIEEYAQSEGALPPGLNYSATRKVGIRRA